MRQGPLPKTGAQYLEECVPKVFDCHTVLYIGATARRQLLVSEFRAHGAIVDLLEIWQKNIEDLICAAQHDLAADIFRYMWLGDVRNLRCIVDPNMWWSHYDVICWWHGPEHIEQRELSSVLDAMADLADKKAVCACPWGKFSQGAVEGNIYERHLSELGPEDFIERGWNARGFGERDDPWSYVIAWKAGWKERAYGSQ